MILVIVVYCQYSSLFCVVILPFRRKLGKIFMISYATLIKISNWGLKEPVIGRFQIKYFRKVLFHAKMYANASDDQKYSNMSDLSDFVGENIIYYEMRDKIIQLHHNKNDLEKQLIRTPKPNDKEAIKK